MQQSHATLAVMAAFLFSTASALAAGSGMPGDNGKPAGTGIPAVPTGQPAAPRPPQPKPARAPAVEVALTAVKAIAEACKQYPLGIAVVNSVGEPILVYIPDGSRTMHSYGAIRKAYSAVTFKAPTSEFISKAQQDIAVADKVKADPNLVAFGGGIPLKVGDEIIGAIGVSGAEPGGHDEECGLIGLEKIKGQLK